jgi:hypothetical protein
MIDLSEIISKMSNLNGEGGRWDDFDIAHEAFNDMVEEQKEALKGTLEEDVVGLNVSIDKFGNRWRQLKPTEAKSWEYAEIQKIFIALEVYITKYHYYCYCYYYYCNTYIYLYLSNDIICNRIGKLNLMNCKILPLL